jgi:dihydrodipicolinate synthase/N-acetylneuraminate lyase
MPIPQLEPAKATRLRQGLVIPAHPLALTAERKLDERHQRALTRYYLESGAGAVAVGVHTTQFAIRAPTVGLYRPVLELAAETVREGRWVPDAEPIVLIAGVVGESDQAVTEAALARDLGYDAVLLSLGALADATEDLLIAHCERVAEVLPLFGFYLQPAVGGRPLSQSFWRRFAAIENVVAIKVAPFDRYATLDVLHGVALSGRTATVALYTGNDDSIVADLLLRLRTLDDQGRDVTLGFVGGLLGHWAVWTSKAVELLRTIHNAVASGSVDLGLMDLGAAITDMNAAIFDPRHDFAGCIPGIHEVLRRQGLLAGTWTLDLAETLSAGQAAEIDRVSREFPELRDDEFVASRLDAWLA